MKTLVRFLAPLALLASTFLAADAHAASKTKITDASAKGFVRKAVKADQGRFNWSVKLGKGPAARREFTANVKWGKGPHIMIAVRPVFGTVDMRKGKGAPAGQDRVHIRRLMPM